jgi:hypothetical protein
VGTSTVSVVSGVSVGIVSVGRTSVGVVTG